MIAFWSVCGFVAQLLLTATSYALLEEVAPQLYFGGRDPVGLSATKDFLYFSANGQSIFDRQLVISNGTAEGTFFLQFGPTSDLLLPSMEQLESRFVQRHDGFGGALPNGNVLFYAFYEPNTTEPQLWISDGSLEGTRPLMKDPLLDEQPQWGDGYEDAVMRPYGDNVLVTGRLSFWITNGTANGTFPTGAETFSEQSVPIIDGDLFFYHTETELFEYNGDNGTMIYSTTQPGEEVVRIIGTQNGRIYWELYLQSGRWVRTRVLSLAIPAAGSWDEPPRVHYKGESGLGDSQTEFSVLRWTKVLNDKLVANAVRMGENSRDCALLDISLESNHTEEIFQPRGNYSDFYNFTLVEEELQDTCPEYAQVVFGGTALVMANPYRVWITDGTEEGTLVLFDLFDPESEIEDGVMRARGPFRVVELDGYLYFAVQNNTADYVHRTDGTAEGTALVGAAPQFKEARVFQDEIYFLASTGLWKLTDDDDMFMPESTNSTTNNAAEPTLAPSGLPVT